jgi:hypothetical protein
MALTGVAADLRAGAAQAIARRLLSVTAMFAGAVAGALLVIHDHTAFALVAAAGLLLIVAAAALQTRHPAGAPQVATG